MSAIFRPGPLLHARKSTSRTASSIASQYGRTPPYRRTRKLAHEFTASSQHAGSHLPRSSSLLCASPLRSEFLPTSFILRPSPVALRLLHTRSTLFQQQRSNEEVKDPPRQEETVGTSASDSAGPSEDASQSSSEPKSKDQESSKGQDGQEEESGGKGKKEAPPPPPHGDKSPLQVFMDTLKTEFKASKEWNESTKALASSAHDFTQNETLRRAREAYGAASGAATSTTGKVFKNTGKAIGQSAAWTWDTLPVKGLRAGVSATGRGLEKITRPVRETEAFKSVRDVIDDGSSSRYGGWTEKEQRKQNRERREIQEAQRTGRPIRRPENMEEDPEAGTNITLHKDAAWKESWRSFRDDNRVMQHLFNLKSSYHESENPLISTARSITDRVAGFFAENETAMVIKKFREMDPSFQLEPFLQDMREYILPEVLDAYVKGDTEVLRLWLSAAQYQVYTALMHQYTTAGLKSDGRILDIRNVDVLSARLLDPGEIPVFIITCRTQEVHVYRNSKSNELAAGMEDRVQQVTYAIGVTRIPEDVLLVPTAEYLLTQIDTESQTAYSELVYHEDFLSSHILRIQGGSATNHGKDWTGLREGKAKTKQYNTLNGRAVVIKDAFVYTNRGFTNLTQAQLLQDEVYYDDSADLSSWLIYYISRPLIGNVQKVPATSAESRLAVGPSLTINQPVSLGVAQKKAISSLSELLNNFPMIAKQMQPRLDQLVEQFSKDVERTPPTARSSSSSATTLVADEPGPNGNDESTPLLESSIQLSRTVSRASTALSTMDRHLRETLETLVLSAIDVFQAVDKQQLSLLGETTELSGPVVENFIERHVAGQVHAKVLFPKIRASTKLEDHELEGYIKQMGDADILQIGISDTEGFGGKRELSRRVQAGIIAFRKMNSAGSPQEMLDTLLETQQCLTVNSESLVIAQIATTTPEKMMPTASMNADTLVSLLLVVVIRSNVRSLQARLMYMRDFIFLTDVESGHAGYALSTFEAVLSYLFNNSKALRKISHANKQLWRAICKGDVSAVKSMLDPSADSEGENGGGDLMANRDLGEDLEDTDGAMTNGHSKTRVHAEPAPLTAQNLSHVFPIEAREQPDLSERPKIKKRVSMDTRSMSGSSVHSFASMSSTIGSVQSLINGETTAEQLCQTQDASGNSIFFMAIESSQVEVLRYLLQLKDLVRPKEILEDRNSVGQTLLSAAVQSGNSSLIDSLLDFVIDNAEHDQQVRDYLASPDISGRSVAHYCFSAPYLIPLIGQLLPWQQKDKNGQTPLFAMCRSYDHENYHELAMKAIAAAARYQRDSEILQLADHVDGKGNTLLHTVNDAMIIRHFLSHCNADPNSQNDRKFTPLMVASKYARLDTIRAFFSDLRIDLQARDARGLTAVEVGKDEDVRNRIDDMVLLLADPLIGSRRTTITRGILVDDGSIRLVVKSGAPSNHGTITVTTSRRTSEDFENLVSWLSLEQPASWLPSVTGFRSPFQISPRPSKQVLRDIQLRLDGFLQAMLSHSTFGTHEMLWEFFLVPDVDWRSLAERAHRKAEIRVENLAFEYTPLVSPSEISEVKIFTGHAIDQLQHVHSLLRTVTRRVICIRNVSNDISEAYRIAMKQFADTVPFIPVGHLAAAQAFAASLTQTAYPPVTQLQYNLLTTVSTTSALLQSLSRPSSLIGNINALRGTIAKNLNSAPSANSRRTQSNRILAGLGSLIDNTRGEDAESKAAKAQREMEALGRELRFTHVTNAGELAAWQLEHGKSLVKGIRDFAKGMVVRERERLAGMERARRRLLLAKVEYDGAA